MKTDGLPLLRNTMVEIVIIQDSFYGVHARKTAQILPRNVYLNRQA